MIQYKLHEFNDSGSFPGGGSPVLKLLACLFMLIDHAGVLLVAPADSTLYMAMRIVGRLAFPIFAYSVAVGFTRTRNPYRYLLRMALWALITELVIKGTVLLTGTSFDDVWRRIDFNVWTNVMVTFTFAIVMLGGIEFAIRSYRDRVASLRLIAATPGAHGSDRFGVRFNPGGLSFPPALGIPLGIALVVLSFFAVTWLHSDYDVFGLLAVLVFYIPLRIWPVSVETGDTSRDARRIAQIVGLVLLNVAWIEFAGMYWIELFSVCALPLILIRWPDRKPTQVAKYFFYVFYPVHFALLVLLKYALKA
jgi:hypothetical protein